MSLIRKPAAARPQAQAMPEAGFGRAAMQAAMRAEPACSAAQESLAAITP